MAKQINKSELPLSSTPIQSFEDSGYFGSDQKKSTFKNKAFNACSPIKKLFIKAITSRQLAIEQVSNAHEALKTNNNHDNIKSSSLFDLVHDLAVPDTRTPSQRSKFKDLTNFQSLFHDDSLSLDSLCSIDSLPKDTDINYELFPGIQTEKICTPQKNKVERPTRIKVDFLHELKQINCESIISNILSNISAADLCKASCVSKIWRVAVSQDKRANYRKQNFLNQQKEFLTGPSKENRLGVKFGPAREHKKAFSCLTNTYHTTEQISPKTSPEKTKFDSFLCEVQEGHTKLLRCLKCGYASKTADKNIYICTHCYHKFCCLCHDSVLENHECHKPQLPKTIIGSKQSKKNLKRL